MTKMNIKKITILIVMLSINSNSFSYASPWAAVGDIALRNDVERIMSYIFIIFIERAIVIKDKF